LWHHLSFFLFGDLTRDLRNCYFQIAEEYLGQVRKLMGAIPPEALLDVFHDWIAGCESVIANDENHVKYALKWLSLFCIIRLNGQDTPHGEGHFPLSRVVIKHCL
jgi:hypothetical protein